MYFQSLPWVVNAIYFFLVLFSSMKNLFVSEISTNEIILNHIVPGPWSHIFWHLIYLFWILISHFLVGCSLSLFLISWSLPVNSQFSLSNIRIISLKGTFVCFLFNLFSLFFFPKYIQMFTLQLLLSVQTVFFFSSKAFLFLLIIRIVYIVQNWKT